MSLTDFALSVGAGVVANLIFTAIVLTILVLARLRYRVKLLAFFGITKDGGTVHIVLSNLYLDGDEHRPKAAENVTHGYAGAAVAQPEYLAAQWLEREISLSQASRFEKIMSRFVPGIPNPPDVVIRPSFHDHDAKTNYFEDEYRDDNGFSSRSTTVVIGSPVYNRAARDLIGTATTIGADETSGLNGNQEGNQEGKDPAQVAGPPRSVEIRDTVSVTETLNLTETAKGLRATGGSSEVSETVDIKTTDGTRADKLRKLCFVKWTRDLRLNKPKGIRYFEWTQRPPPDTRQVATRDKGYEQSVLQRVKAPWGPSENGTIVLCCGVGQGGTAAAMAMLLWGTMNWQKIRRALKDQGNIHGDFALMFSRPVEDPDNEEVKETLLREEVGQKDLKFEWVTSPTHQ
jgi:hypothetical protein